MRLLLISSSAVHGYGYLEQQEADLRALLEGVSSVSFIPFALQDHEGYTAKVRDRFLEMGLEVSQVGSRGDVEAAEAIFIGGGNTFRLLKALYDRDLLELIRTRVRGGLPYIGSSAGTNVATPTIKTTNDMPIVYPPSFDALGLVGFQINPHYQDPDPSSTHKGETREERLLQFLEENDTPVVGLREGSSIRVDGNVARLLGTPTARIFRRGEEPYELEGGSVIDL